MTSYAEGYYYTSGNQIVDHAGSPVRLQSVSWFGFEGGMVSLMAFGCHARTPTTLIKSRAWDLTAFAGHLRLKVLVTRRIQLTQTDPTIPT